MRLKFDYLEYTCFIFLGYASSQIHELAHWTMAMAIGCSQLVMGFDRWYVAGANGPLWPILAAGPFTTMVLALLGLLLLLRGNISFVKHLGFFLAFYNTIFNLGSIVAGISSSKAAIYDLSYSELAWKTLLAPLSAIVLALVIAYSRKILQMSIARLIYKFIIPTIMVSLIVKTLDTIAWLGYEIQHPLFTVAYGFITIVIIVNIIVLVLSIMVVVKIFRGYTLS